MKKRLLNLMMAVFAGCIILCAAVPVFAATSYTLSNGVLTISGTGAMDTYVNNTSMPWFSQRESITKIVVKEGVTEISKYAFTDLENATSVSLPSTLTKIGDSSFYYCESLTSITIPDSVTYIGEVAFNECHGLTSITIPAGVTHLEYGSFMNCTSLSSVTIKGNVTNIATSFFKGCTSLTSFTCPSSVTLIDSYAFSGCTALKTFTVRPNVKEIRTYAFNGCTALKNLYFVCNAPTIGTNAFNGVTATAKYIRESDNATWTESVRQNYGGTITWNADFIYLTSCVTSQSTYTYNGKACTPVPTLKSGDYTHIQGTDYTCTYSDNVNAGTARMVIRGMGIWGSSTYSRSFTIKKASTTMTVTNNISLYPKATNNIGISVTKFNANDSFTYTYASSDTSVATVNANGVVTAVAPGTCTITTTAESQNYETMKGETTVTVNTPIPMSDCTVTLSQSSYTYDGTEKRPTVTVKTSGGSELYTGYYTVEYSDNVNAGTAAVTVTANSSKILSITGSKTVNFTIAKADTTMTLPDPFGMIIGCGNSIVPSMTVLRDSDKNDFTYQFASEDTSIATVTARGYVTAVAEGTTRIVVKVDSKNYKTKLGYLKVTVYAPTDLATCTLTMSDTSYVYDGTAKEPEVTVTSAEGNVITSRWYNVAYSNNVNAGTATVTITSADVAYTGTLTGSFTIEKADSPELTYSGGRTLTPGMSFTPVFGTYLGTLSFTSRQPGVASVTSAGKITGVSAGLAQIAVTASGDGNHKSTTCLINVTVVNPISISQAEIRVEPTSYTYDGTTKIPVVTLTYNGELLEEGIDYSLSYYNNTEPGIATIAIKGLNYYAGSTTTTFEIIEKAEPTITFASAAVTKYVDNAAFTNKATADVEGLTIRYSSDNTAVATVDESTGKVTLVGAGTALITASIDGSDSCEPASASYKLTVNKRSQKVTPEETDVTKVMGDDAFTLSAASSGDGALYFYSSNKEIATVSSSTGKVTIKGVGEVTIKVYAKETAVYKKSSTVSIALTIKPGQVTGFTTSILSTGIKLEWDAVPGATSYQVYRRPSSSSTYTRIKTTTSTSFTNTSVTNGTNYYYKVRAIYQDPADADAAILYGAYCGYKTRMFLTRPDISSVTNVSTCKMTVKWTANTKATGYSVQISTDSTFATGVKTYTVEGASTLTRTISSLTKDKTYYVRIRAYKTVSGVKKYSQYSAKKSVKISK